MKIVQFSCQLKSSKEYPIIAPIHRSLNSIFYVDSCVENIKQLDGFSVIFRVDSADRKFGGAGLQRLAKERGKKWISVDFVIPYQRISGPPDELNSYLISVLSDCFNRFIDKGKKNFWVDDVVLREMLFRGLREFEEINTIQKK